MSRAGRTRPHRGVHHALRAALLAGFLTIAAATSEAQSRVKQVLVLQSIDRGNLQLDEFTGAFRVRLDELAQHPVNVIQVVVGATGFVGAPEDAIVAYIRSIYADRPPPDLIMTIAGPAAAFARKYRRQLFPGTPLLLASVDQRWFGGVPLGENETAVAVVNDFPRMIDDILRILPETRQVYMMIGAGVIGHFWRRELETEFARFRGRVTFLWPSEPSLAAVLRRCANLPSHSAIVYLNFGTDWQGGAYADEQILADLHATANAPVFGIQGSMMGHGIVGGTLMPVDDLVRRAAESARRILDGVPPSRIKVLPRVVTQPTFDWRELQRWNIPESRLPPGSVVRYRGPTLWGQHRVAVLGTLGALAFQSFLIALLLVERRARQRAETESRSNFVLAADANRRETVASLTSSIGHELAQPLTAILNNASALQNMARSDPAASDETGEILSDIRSGAVLASQIIERHRMMLRSHELRLEPIDLHAVIDETLALVAHDMQARRIAATLVLATEPCVIDGDQVLLKQVLVNLVRNAMEALTETPPARRQITIRTAVKADVVELSVRDTGTGLPAEIIDTLFTPFVTTKSRGLGIGLTIVRRILDAHTGTIAARDNGDGGATFTVTLPRKLTRVSTPGVQVEQIPPEATM